MRNIFIIFISLVLISSCDPFLTQKTYTSTSSLAISASDTKANQIHVTDSGRLSKINEIKLNGFNHTNAGDLKVSLQTPAGTIVLVANEGSTNSFSGDYVFVDKEDDTGLNRLIYLSGDVVPETYQADGSFNPGHDAVAGYWILSVENSGSTIGSITSWEVTVSIDNF